MGLSYTIKNQHAPHFITCTVHQWVDVFTRAEYVNILLNSIRYCQKHKGLEVHSWVIMSNHIHLIVSMKGEPTISDFVRDMKKHTSIEITNLIAGNDKESRRKWMLDKFSFAGERNSNNERYQFWQQDSHPICLDTSDKVMQRLNYLHDNPVRAGWVWHAWEYKYSSAIDYMGKSKGLLEVVLLV